MRGLLLISPSRSPSKRLHSLRIWRVVWRPWPQGQPTMTDGTRPVWRRNLREELRARVPWASWTVSDTGDGPNEGNVDSK